MKEQVTGNDSYGREPYTAITIKCDSCDRYITGTIINHARSYYECFLHVANISGSYGRPKHYCRDCFEVMELHKPGKGFK